VGWEPFSFFCFFDLALILIQSTDLFTRVRTEAIVSLVFSSFTQFYFIFFQEHSPPTNLVMKKGGWIIGSENQTVLVNKDGEEEASRKSWEQKRQASLFRSGVFAPGHEDAQKSCAIM
jgi:hypothetical protein